MTRLLCQSVSISSNWIHLCCECFELFSRFWLFLEVFWLSSESWPFRNFLGPFLAILRPSRNLSLLNAEPSLHKSASTLPLKLFVLTRKFPSSDVELLETEILSNVCHRWGQQIVETSLLCRMEALSGVLGSAKNYQSDPAIDMVQIEFCRWGLLGTLLLSCTLFWHFAVYEGWWQDVVANNIEACLWFHSVCFGQLRESGQL